MTTGEQNFYVAAATVLPVLFLGLAIERTVTENREAPGNWREYVADVVAYPAAIFLMVSSEVTALAALLEENTSWVLLFVTTLGLAVCGALAFDLAAQRAFDEMAEQTANYRPGWVGAIDRARTVSRVIVLVGVLVILGLVTFD